MEEGRLTDFGVDGEVDGELGIVNVRDLLVEPGF
jgi:hypothetical protein